ncbi:3-oxoacyl-[acyl-carrier-protein] synthase II [Gordonia effusa NBRC 100432]|uniref:3-oxoacyl-[acyl-carrier-protein] synthase II n=1 Tax=Gordonia effusa NBRC 100432 TaxID=1077974 RepID=H0R263_9ACTN|nr:beta-ketoacyl-ACP synthase II [Gordonia effusa]GAB19168.1 3-oxoacyl-[acyl-carrier-protein] synthase II [Gordonia effusa NBRC 100432]
MDEALGSQMARRASITATAVVASLGDDLDELWSQLLDGRSGISALTAEFIDEFDLPVRIGGVLPFHPSDELTRVEVRRMSYVEQMAVVLARRLWREAGNPIVDPERLAVCIGTGLGGAEALVDAVQTMDTRGYRKISPFAVPMIMPNGPAAYVAVELGARAGVYAPVSACASGAEAIARGWQLISDGEADIVVAGGVEGTISAVPIASFAMMRAMSTRNGDPAGASRPFDRDRDGFVFGEAGALILLESAEHAARRGASSIADVVGAGIASDGHHIVAPVPDGSGIARAMRKALTAAGVTAEQVDHVNAHATSTGVGDAAEARAISDVIPNASVYAPKGALGHSIGAVGALETALVAKTLASATIPPTLNLTVQDDECELDIVHTSPRTGTLRHALTNSVGFGGHNVSLLLQTPNQSISTVANVPT